MTKSAAPMSARSPALTRAGASPSFALPSERRSLVLDLFMCIPHHERYRVRNLWIPRLGIEVLGKLSQCAAERCGMHRIIDSMGRNGRNSVRCTATLTKEQVGELERIAKREHVSVSWLLRKG